MGFPVVLAAACPSGPNRFVGLVTGVRTPDPFTHRRFRMSLPDVVSREQWLEARRRLLA